MAGPGRTPIVGGNWKMNLDHIEAQELARDMRRLLGSHRAAHVVVFPPHPWLTLVARTCADSAVEVGGQDLHPEPKGAYTGGVSGRMLRSLGCTRVLVGHSERRTWFGECDRRVADKLRAALDAGLAPVLCVGETADEHRAGRTHAVLERQLASAVTGLDARALRDLVVAYEPVWAIGTGHTATPAQAQEAHAALRTQVARHLGDAFAQRLRIQYGGSVTGDTAAALIAQPDVDGALVGGASLRGQELARIVRACSARGASR